MGLFDFEQEEKDEKTADSEDSTEKSLCKLVGNGDGCSLRLTVPKEIVRSQNLSADDHLRIRETEDGFVAERIDV